MDKVLKFSKELGYINSDKVKNACQEMIKLLPDYFLRFQHHQQASIIQNML